MRAKRYLGVRDIAETYLNRLLLLLILKSTRRSCSVEKCVLKNFTGKHLSWSLILIKLRACNAGVFQCRRSNTGTGNGMRGMRGMLKRFRGMLNKIPGNAQQDSGECSKRFRGMFKKIPGNAQKDSGECSRRFRGMLEKIPGNVPKDSGESKFRFIL